MFVCIFIMSFSKSTRTNLVGTAALTVEPPLPQLSENKPLDWTNKNTPGNKTQLLDWLLWSYF